LLRASAFAVGLLSASGAWAQCVTNLPPIFSPFVQSGAVNSLVSSINMVNTAFLTQSSAFVSAPAGPRPDQQGGGIWARGIGGSVDTNSSSSANADLSAIGFGTGVVNCNTDTRTNFSGVQIGHDISVLNGGGTGANFHVGVTAGYIEAESRDITPGASFTNDLQVPFAGVYAAFTKGNFFADAQARWDSYQSKVTDPSLGFSNQSFNATGFSLTGNLGYNIPLHRNWFIEPSAGIIWSNVSVDPINIAGPFGGLIPARADIDDIKSVLGRASVSVGTTVNAGHLLWQPYFTASVFHEFAGDVHTRISANTFGGFVGPDITADVATSRVGTYAQLALGSAVVIPNTGWLGYGRVDYRIGENIEGWSVNAGLRYQFTPDRRARGLKDDFGPVQTAYNWTGPYIGVSGGRLIGDESWIFVGGGSSVEPAFAGYLIGGQAGYNLQLGRVVLGVEGDYDFSNANGGVACPNASFFTCEGELHRLASVTGRVGITWQRALFYAKGGWAAGEVSAAGSLNLVPNPGGFVNGVETTRWMNGWTAGAGMEFALSNSWSAKAEWMHYDLGTARFQVSDGPEFADASVNGNLVRVGLNYQFHHRAEPRPLK
jgi:opacity protein-like surface antigen